MKDKFEVVKFVDNQFELDVRADRENDTVWLTQKEIAFLFDVSTDNIGLHIKNIIKEGELDNSTAEESSVVQIEGNRKITRKIKIYNLDMIISVGYRLKSHRGIIFRRWANKILKDYLIEGYVINNKRMLALNKTVEIQNKMLANTLDVETSELKNIIDLYTNALTLLDNYDHQCVSKPSGNSKTVNKKYISDIIN